MTEHDGLASLNVAYERGFFFRLGAALEPVPGRRLRISGRAYRDQYIAGARDADRVAGSLTDNNKAKSIHVRRLAEAHSMPP